MARLPRHRIELSDEERVVLERAKSELQALGRLLETVLDRAAPATVLFRRASTSVIAWSYLSLASTRALAAPRDVPRRDFGRAAENTVLFAER